MLRHPWQGLLALSGIGLGVAAVLAVELANSSARAAFLLSAQHLQGKATHRLSVPGASLPDAIYVELQRQSGAPPMAPVVNGWVQIEGSEGRFQLVGFDLFAATPFRDRLVNAPVNVGFTADWLTQSGAMMLDAATAHTLDVVNGDTLNVNYRGNTFPLNVLHIEKQHGGAGHDLLLVDIATAKSVLDMANRLSHVDLILDAESEYWIRQRIPASVKLETIAEQAQGVTRLSAAFELNLTAMSLLALLVGMFLIFNAVTFSIVQRRTLFGRLRAIGVTPWELFSLILLETALLAIVGIALGILLGVWLGQGLTRLVSATISELYYDISVAALQLRWQAVAIAASLGAAATLMSTIVPAWYAARTPPLTTLSRIAIERLVHRGVPVWALLGLVLLLSGLLLALALPGGVIMSFSGLFLLVLGAAMMTPVGIRALHRVLAHAPLSGIWSMGIRDLDRHLSRLGVAVAALMVALSASVGVGVMVESMRDSVNSWLTNLLSADLYVAAEAFDEGAYLPAPITKQLSQLDSVAAFSRYRDRTLPLAGRQVELVGAHLAVPSRPGFALLSGASSAWKKFDGGAALVSEPLAYHLGLAPGSSLILPTPTGPVTVPVAAVFRDYASEHGRVFINEQVYRKYWPEQQVSTMALFARNADVATMRRDIRKLTADYPLVLTPAYSILKESMAVFDRTFRVTEALRAISLAVAFIGVLSALMALQLERGREYAVLRALGLTRGQIAKLIVGESLLMGLLAACLAIPVGMLMAWVLIESVQQRAFGWTMPFSIDGSLLLQTLLVGLLAAGLGAIYPAWRSAHRDPAPALRED